MTMHAALNSTASRSAALTASGPPRMGRLVRQSLAAMTPVERSRVLAMYGVIAGLHVAGFFVLFVFVVPSHYKGLGFGVAVLAYTLGLRHAFDADHIAAIDNTTRKVLGERQGTGAPRPFGFGFFFSLGHSSVVVALGVAIIAAEKTVFAAVSDSGSSLERFGGFFGTVVSASFLLLIGLLNLVVLTGIVRVFASMRRGEYDEAELERQLEARGLFYRFFGRWMKAITKEWQLYPVGVLFGLGFDTATEVALLATTALLATGHIPWYAIACLPVLFTAGMTLMDTTDGLFMNLAYGWAFFNPVRKVYYNLAITGLSVAICLFIGGIETLSLLPYEFKGLSHSHGLWGVLNHFNLNTAGFVIVGMFIVTWLAALLIWRYAHIEEKWSARLEGAGALTVCRPSELAAPDARAGAGRRCWALAGQPCPCVPGDRPGSSRARSARPERDRDVSSRSPRSYPMERHPSGLWERLRRSMAADPGRFAGGSAVSDPLGLLAVEQERVGALQPRRYDASSRKTGDERRAEARSALPDRPA
jgi:nickel/cobalt transporter (NiCoT) family protein